MLKFINWINIVMNEVQIDESKTMELIDLIETVIMEIREFIAIIDKMKVWVIMIEINEWTIVIVIVNSIDMVLFIITVITVSQMSKDWVIDLIGKVIIINKIDDLINKAFVMIIGFFLNFLKNKIPLNYLC